MFQSYQISLLGMASEQWNITEYYRRWACQRNISSVCVVAVAAAAAVVVVVYLCVLKE